MQRFLITRPGHARSVCRDRVVLVSVPKGSESPRLEGSYFIWDSFTLETQLPHRSILLLPVHAQSADADRSCSLLRLLLLRGHVLELAIESCQPQP